MSTPSKLTLPTQKHKRLSKYEMCVAQDASVQIVIAVGGGGGGVGGGGLGVTPTCVARRQDR